MANDNQKHTRKLDNKLLYLNEALPETARNFTQFGETALETGTLDKKTKLFIALTISVIKKSPECIIFHLRNLIEEGISKQVLTELVSVIAYMDGGPGLIAGSDLLTLYDKLTVNCSEK